MTSLKDLWVNNREFLIDKSIHQIIGMCGDGKLRDGNEASNQFREFLKIIPSSLLSKYSMECLSESFTESGYALQDIINQIGSRIGFYIKYGLYRGRKDQIGFDGIWTGIDGYSIVVEVKTTDAYRMNLDTISEYRRALISESTINKESSILIVVGRKDTGDLEAQIRGSKHAWDIRLISVDAIINLMEIKENLNNIKTIQQINEVLKPYEYTRLDKLIDVIFTTTKDASLDEPENEPEESNNLKKSDETKTVRFHPVNFHSECIDLIQQHFNEPLIKKSRSSYNNPDNTLALTCSISKAYESPSQKKYWFAFHPYYIDFLKESPKAYVAFGCGSPERIALLPFDFFNRYIKNFWVTENIDRMYWHINIFDKGKETFLQVPKINEMINISKYMLNNIK